MNVKDLREKSGLTQAELSEKTGIPRDRIAKWEQGKGSPKSVDEKILETIFGKNIQEQVPNNGSVRPQEAQHAPDYRDDLIALLKEKLNLSERQHLLYLQTNNALLKTILQGMGKIQARVDKRKLEEVLVELNNITELHLQSLKKDGS